MTNKERNMIEDFQCPGCTCGEDTENCSQFQLERHESQLPPNLFGGLSSDVQRKN